MPTSSTRTSEVYDRALTVPAEREVVTRAREEREARFEALVRRIDVGVFRATVEGRLVEANPAIVRMLGYADERELLGVEMQHAFFIDRQDCDRLRTQLARGPVERAAMRWKRLDGSCIDVRLSLQTTTDVNTGLTWCDGLV